MKTLNSKLIFAALQILDLVTTVACIHYGFPEGNPLTLHLIAAFGLILGLVISKLLACAAMFPMKKLVWVGNAAYMFIVSWNLFIIGVVSFVKAMPRS